MNDERIKSLADAFRSLRLERELRIMEVCGTHTTEFFRTGVRDLFPEKLSLVDGPGCPVCVTPNDYLDRAIEIARVHGVIVATFGDMVKVPSSYGSLAREKANGMRLEVVYSPLDALDLAVSNPAACDVPERGIRDHGAGRGGHGAARAKGNRKFHRPVREQAHTARGEGPPRRGRYTNRRIHPARSCARLPALSPGASPRRSTVSPVWSPASRRATSSSARPRLCE